MYEAICRSCAGTGEQGFYDDDTGEHIETCRSCGGKGFKVTLSAPGEEIIVAKERTISDSTRIEIKLVSLRAYRDQLTSSLTSDKNLTTDIKLMFEILLRRNNELIKEFEEKKKVYETREHLENNKSDNKTSNNSESRVS